MKATLLPLLAVMVSTPEAVAQVPTPREAVTVELSSFDFAPSTLELVRGRAYELVLVNKSGSDHDFTAPEFFSSALIAEANTGSIVRGKVTIVGKDETRIDFVPLRAGIFQFHCSHLLHASLGMRGTIRVS